MRPTFTQPIDGNRVLASSLRAAMSSVLAAGVALAESSMAQAGCCTGDLDGDGAVNGVDLTILLQNWGACGACAADITGDGIVRGEDWTQSLVGWGQGSCTWYTVLEHNPDPAIVTSAALRNAITATGYPWRVRDDCTNIEMC